ncbi:MAG: sigma-70 family RNA polymerase sigma factor [Proteobacteria bacterium]|nr:sigma-70 family RNA polymerase sigma factor [Pseudomonadota bacterium]
MQQCEELIPAFMGILHNQGSDRLIGNPCAGEVADDIGPLLREVVERAEQAWPGIRQSAVDFVGFLGRVAPTDGTLEWFRHCAADDLGLVFSSMSGVSEAQTRLDELARDISYRVAAKMRLSDADQADLLQELRMDLLVKPWPTLYKYSGRGSLRGWLRVITTHRVLNALKRERRAMPMSDAALDRMALGDTDPELAAFKSHYLKEFRIAFGQALADLSAKERNILRYHVMDGLKIKEIASLYGVNRVTVSRWFAHIRRTLLEGTRKRLARRLGASPAELQSVLRLIESRLDATFSDL